MSMERSTSCRLFDLVLRKMQAKKCPDQMGSLKDVHKVMLDGTIKGVPGEACSHFR